MVYHFIVVFSYALSVASFGAGLMHLLFGSWRATSTDTLDSLKDEEVSVAAWTGSAFLLGQGVLSQFWLLLALFGWFTPAIVSCVLLVAALCGLRFAIMPAKVLAAALVHEIRRLGQEPWYWSAFACCCLAVVFLSGVEGILLPVPAGKDAAAAYMPLAKMIAATQQLAPLPGGAGIAQLGLVGEMHWAALMALGTGGAAKAFSWPAALAGTFMLLALGSAAGVGRRGQWIVVAMVWTSSTVLVHVWDGKVDLFGAAAGLAAYYWVIRATQGQTPATRGHHAEPSWRTLGMAGLFTSLAVVSKLTLLVAMVPGLLLLLAWRTLARPNRADESVGIDPGQEAGWLQVRIISVVRALVIFAVAGSAILGPQLLKNAVLFGEPLAPICYINTPHNSDMDGAVLTNADANYIFSIYPLALVFGRFAGMGWTLSPLILVLLPLVMYLPRAPSMARNTLFQLTVTAVVGVVAWHLFRSANFAPRYMLPTILLFTLAPAAAAEHISRHEHRPRLLAGVLMLCLFLSALFQVRDFFVSDNLLIALKNEVRNRPNFPINAELFLASEVVNRDADAGERVLLGMHDCYWLRSDLIRALGITIDATTAAPQEISQTERWLLAHQQGYRYVLVATGTTPGDRLAAELGIMTDGSVKALPDNLCVEKLFHESNCIVLRIREAH